MHKGVNTQTNDKRINPNRYGGKSSLPFANEQLIKLINCSENGFGFVSPQAQLIFALKTLGI